MLRYTFSPKIIIILLYSLFSISLYAENKSTILKRVIPSVVTVYASNSLNFKELSSALRVQISPKISSKISVASAIVVKENGILVTNYHVIENKKTIIIITTDGVLYEGEVLKYEKEIDLALIRIKGNVEDKFNPIKMNVDRNSHSVGDDVFAIGNPFGIGISVTSGIISALPSASGIVSNMGNLIQTDAVMNPGNSGGALVNIKGELIGINTALFSNRGSFSGIGFAIPSELVKLFIERAMEGKDVRNNWLGVAGIDITPGVAKVDELPTFKGVVVLKVYPNSPSEKAGIKENDIIKKFNNQAVTSMAELSFLVASLNEGEAATVEIIRDNKTLNIILIPALLQSSDEDTLVIYDGILAGLTLIKTNSPKAIAINNIVTSADDKALMVFDVKRASSSERLGIRVGDKLVSINNEEITSINDFVEMLNKNPNSYTLIFIRGKNYITINISNSNVR